MIASRWREVGDRAPPVFRTAASELRDRQVRLGDVLTSGDERRLIEQIGEAADPLSMLEHFVRHRIGVVAPPEPIDLAIAAKVAGPESGGVGRIADELDLTSRQLHRRSVRAFGYGPSTLGRLIRFQRFVLLAQRTNPRPTIGMLAACSGYSDHAHLVRDCQSITGRTPSVFLAGQEPTFPEMSDPYKTV